MNWIRRLLGLDLQEEKITKLLEIAQSSKNENFRVSKESIPEEFNPSFEIIDPLDITQVWFKFEPSNSFVDNKIKINENAKSFLRNLGSSVPEFVSNGMLAKSYSFVFPKGVAGNIMNMANGQGTAIMQGGKILKHGGYVTNLATAAPLLAYNLGSLIVRQHYLAKINENLSKISLSLNQLLELEFIKKHSKVESLINFFSKASDNYKTIENNKEYRTAYLTNILSANIEIFELIEFYKKSFKLINKENVDEIKLNLQYFLALHTIYVQGKLLELKYAQEYNETLINNLINSFTELSEASLSFLKENQMETYYKVLDAEKNKSKWDYVLLKAEKKEHTLNNLNFSKNQIIDSMNFQREEMKNVSKHLFDFAENINKRKQFIIENGELYEVNQ